ncbi:MAG: bifunctional DNA-formamidopyrimidine glycosylase/DNA-(apurinic or apyrimidinic site) lyase [Dehalococcoidia bacterium]|nr:bifunctional DNA-formamidopyrimidine glycosylase/DNA-(apurinic or apyrimidinic site) lyase [Dehalococcoidia bacterium]
MPELPEVETIKNDLRPRLEGRRITSVSILWPRMVLGSSPEDILLRLTGRTIEEVDRRGKYLVLRLNGGELLLLHMRMTGSLLLRDTLDAGPERYVTAVLGLDNGRELLFCDRRKLGTIALARDESALDGKLGPEPFEPRFTPDVLRERLTRRKGPIKSVLCNQKFIAGIGNMYADEALFLAGIHPKRPAGGLTDAEVAKLHAAIRTVLETGIGNGGATFSDYRRPDGARGEQQNAFYVAHRGGETCKICSTPIKRIPLNGRGTYFCPACQAASTCS